MTILLNGVICNVKKRLHIMYGHRASLDKIMSSHVDNYFVAFIRTHVLTPSQLYFSTEKNKLHIIAHL